MLHLLGFRDLSNIKQWGEIHRLYPIDQIQEEEISFEEEEIGNRS